ncbi:MAG TPA: MauE/DoxX family redox-associated membrane protein [Pyrinomonadaceae bacterium]|nr:MauE/DoxX family redox-associated membrane protein [Pyrinomonadaceae bacterium]
MEILFILIRLFLFAVFALAATGKIVDPAGTRKAATDFGVPASLAGIVAVLLPIAELTFGVMLLFAPAAWWGAIGAASLLGIFTAGMTYQAAKGNEPDCHCFGQLHSEPVGKTSIIRNVAFLLLALAVIYVGPVFQAELMPAYGSGLGLSAMLITVVIAVFTALHYLQGISATQTQLMRRIEMLEILGGDGSPEERNDAGNPSDALPIGAHFPDFQLADTRGRIVAFDHLLARAKPVLFFFVGPTCGPCRELFPEIESWKAELDGKVTFMMISSGTADENIDKFGDADVLLQKNKELGEKAFAKWTPTALLVNADGTVASHPAVGDRAIRELALKVKAASFNGKPAYFPNPLAKPLKIGKSVPDIELETLDGGRIGPDFFRGRRTLVFFWSLSCPHCRTMIDEIKAWETERTESDPQILIFSDGDPEVHREFGLRSPIVLDANYKRAVQYGMSGTPSGILIDENGKIATEIAIGSPNLWALIGRSSSAGAASK